ncbi:class I SAM-dependent methyltransferase [bacterium]|nr:class I SAM-dependent methyltransferase [bacterium]
MSQFWESNFIEKQKIWGDAATDLAVDAADLFMREGLSNILIPGFGYGRNAMEFIKRNIKVTGIEISQTAIKLAQDHFSNETKIHHGSVAQMPFDDTKYDGVFCHALLHLLEEDERKHCIDQSYRHLTKGGLMYFTVISSLDSAFENGEKIGHNRFQSPHGVNLFFYDESAIANEFEAYGLIEAQERQEPLIPKAGSKGQRFWKVLCRKEQ